jgi:mitogen-activated protein kinase 1/3
MTHHIMSTRPNTQSVGQEKMTKGSSAAAPRKVRFNVGELNGPNFYLTDPLGNAYQVVDVIGEGAYGVVVSAIHKPTNTKVAIKKIAPFDHSMFALRTLRELKLLKYFAEEGVSENVGKDDDFD